MSSIIDVLLRSDTVNSSWLLRVEVVGCTLKILVAMSANVGAGAECIASLASGKQVVAHAEQAWAFFKSLGSPKYHVAPMVDQVRLLLVEDRREE
jgi:hypothetical protein